MGFAQVEELPLLGKHRTDEDHQWRLVVASEEAVVTAYRTAPSAADALWTWAIDQAWTMHPDPEYVDDVIDRLGVRVVPGSGDGQTVSFDLIQLDEND
jgi:hypothetical protein